MRWIALFFVVTSAWSMSQEEQDREWAKAMEESRSITTRHLDKIAPAKASNRQAAPVPATPTRPVETAPQRATDDSGCGVGIALVATVVIAIAWLAKKEKRPTGPCVTGWLCQTPLRFDRPIRTPLGSRVKIVTVTLDIFFEESGGSFRIMHARPAENAGSYGNILATNTGEAWTIGRGNIDRADLIEVARAELMENPGLANAMREALKRKLS